MNPQPGRALSPEAAVNAVGTTNGAGMASGTGVPASPHMLGRDPRPVNAGLCGVCLRPLPPSAGAKFCSSRCRQMNYWLKEISKALHDGRAEGIRPRLLELRRFIS